MSSCIPGPPSSQMGQLKMSHRRQKKKKKSSLVESHCSKILPHLEAFPSNAHPPQSWECTPWPENSPRGVPTAPPLRHGALSSSHIFPPRRQSPWDPAFQLQMPQGLTCKRSSADIHQMTEGDRQDSLLCNLPSRKASFQHASRRLPYTHHVKACCLVGCNRNLIFYLKP